MCTVSFGVAETNDSSDLDAKFCRPSFSQLSPSLVARFIRFDSLQTHHLFIHLRALCLIQLRSILPAVPSVNLLTSLGSSPPRRRINQSLPSNQLFSVSRPSRLSSVPSHPKCPSSSADVPSPPRPKSSRWPRPRSRSSRKCTTSRSPCYILTLTQSPPLTRSHGEMRKAKEEDRVNIPLRRLASSCTAKCIPKDYREGELNKGESVCIDRCVAKYMDVNMKIGQKMQEGAAARGAGGVGGAPGMFGR